MLNKIMRKYIIIVLMIANIFLPVSHAGAQDDLFEIGIELQISSQGMDCNYQSEDFAKFTFNFEYPKLIITPDKNPFVAFIDENSNKLVISKISDGESKIILSTTSFGGLAWEKWPIIFTRENNLYFAIYSGYYPSPVKKKIKIFLLDKETGQMNLHDEQIFDGDKRCQLWGIDEYHDQLLLVGNCNYICLKYLPTVLLGGNPTYYQNALFIINKDSTLTKQPIEESGCYNVHNQEYSIGDYQGMSAVWIRETRGLIKKKDEILYSEITDGNKWSNPLKLYSLSFENTTDYNRLNISLASSGKTAFVLWRDIKKGVFLSEIQNGTKSETLKIADIKDIKIDYSEPMAIASTVKVASDNSGNVYTLWVNNSGKDYKLFFKFRIGGKWSTEVIVNQGLGYLRLPDMKIDNEGNVHISYIRSSNSTKPRDEFSCYYMNLVRHNKVEIKR